MQTLLQQIINALSLGSTYAVFGVGCTLVFGVLKVINMAQGAFFMAGAYAGLEIANMNLSWPVALLAAILAGGLLGVITEFVVFRTIKRRGGHRWMGLVASLALARALIACAQEIFGTQILRYPTSPFLAAEFEVGGVRIESIQIVIVCVSILLMLALTTTLKLTTVGRAIRTLAFDEGIASLVGVPVNRTIAATFFIAGGMAGGAGLLLGVLFNVVSPFMGQHILVKGLVVMIIGGLGNIPGAVIGGFLLGFIEVASTAYISSAFRDAIGFGLIFLILLFRPTGLFKGFEERSA